MRVLGRDRSGNSSWGIRARWAQGVTSWALSVSILGVEVPSKVPEEAVTRCLGNPKNAHSSCLGCCRKRKATRDNQKADGQVGYGLMWRACDVARNPFSGGYG